MTIPNETEVRRLSPGKAKVLEAVKRASENVRSWPSWKEVPEGASTGENTGNEGASSKSE